LPISSLLVFFVFFKYFETPRQIVLACYGETVANASKASLAGKGMWEQCLLKSSPQLHF